MLFRSLFLFFSQIDLYLRQSFGSKPFSRFGMVPSKKEAYMNASLSSSHYDLGGKRTEPSVYQEYNSFKDYLETLFPEEIIFRCRITKQSKGLFSSRTLANYDSSPGQEGVPGRFLLNGKVCYHRDSLIAWLLKKIKPAKVRRVTSRADRFLTETSKVKH